MQTFLLGFSIVGKRALYYQQFIESNTVFISCKKLRNAIVQYIRWLFVKCIHSYIKNINKLSLHFITKYMQ